jgi:hypothetical protein
MLLLPKHARRVEFNNARNLLAEIARKWYPELLDEESETFLLPTSTFSEKTTTRYWQGFGRDVSRNWTVCPEQGYRQD